MNSARLLGTASMLLPPFATVGSFQDFKLAGWPFTAIHRNQFNQLKPFLFVLGASIRPCSTAHEIQKVQTPGPNFRRRLISLISAKILTFPDNPR